MSLRERRTHDRGAREKRAEERRGGRKGTGIAHPRASTAVCRHHMHEETQLSLERRDVLDDDVILSIVPSHTVFDQHGCESLAVGQVLRGELTTIS